MWRQYAALQSGDYSCSWFCGVTSPFRQSLHTHSPSLGVDDNGIRLVDHAGDQSFAVMSSAQLRHLDDISARVGPVQVSCDPVDSNTSGHLQIRDLNTERVRKDIQDTGFACFMLWKCTSMGFSIIEKISIILVKM